MNADGSAQKNLGRNSGPSLGSPSFSPDGKRIAFVAPPGDRPGEGDTEVWVMNADGKARRQVTKSALSDWAPAFSPDGKRIAYVSVPVDELAEVFVMDADGANKVRLTENDAVDFDPKWSPDGKRIIFTSQRDGDQDVYVMNADGTGQAQLTRYSPDLPAPAA